MNKTNAIPQASDNRIAFKTCAFCGRSGYCIEAPYCEDYDEEGHPFLTYTEFTCSRCLNNDYQEDLALDLHEFIQSHVYGEGVNQEGPGL